MAADGSQTGSAGSGLRLGPYFFPGWLVKAARSDGANAITHLGGYHLMANLEMCVSPSRLRITS